MKWSVIALVALGAVAALAASLLVNSLRISGQQPVADETPVVEEITIVVAARDLEQGTLLEDDAIEVRPVALSDVQPGSVRQREDAFQKVIARPLNKGEALLDGMFARNLSEAVPNGKMLVDVIVDGSTASLDVPCKVNVMWTSTPEPGNEAESKMLFNGISVWGIGDRTIVSPQGPKDRAVRPSSYNETVLLLVDLKQAQRIKVALTSGSIWLPLCNPSDTWTELESPAPPPAEEKAQIEPEPLESREVLQKNGEEEERFIWVKEGSVWRLRERPD
jgi:Flp pilus assembly protein CpaB